MSGTIVRRRRRRGAVEQGMGVDLTQGETDENLARKAASVFDLPDRLAGKADPALIAEDERHLADVAACLAETIERLEARLAAVRRNPAGAGQRALERDQDVHRLSARLRTLRRFGLEACLGRMVADDGSLVYVGRLGLRDEDGRPLLIDWRSPAAEPFFAATRARPLGIVSRRRYRWSGGVIRDYWDEALSDDAPVAAAALDDQSAFIASLATSRTAAMRDVLGTLQADQDAAIRASSAGALVVDGGPGTGKTVVALHRAAYLLYREPSMGDERGVLVIGPSGPYLDFVADVLPRLGEDGVRLATLRDLVPEGQDARPETDPRVAELKGRAAMLDAIEPAVALYEEVPDEPLDIETPWGRVLRVTATDWAEVFAAPATGATHNEAREQIWQALVTMLFERHGESVPQDASHRLILHRDLLNNEDLVDIVNRAWPLLEATDVVADLWSVPAYLQRCAPWLSPADVRVLQRADGEAWTESDLPLLDVARRRVGDIHMVRRMRQRAAALAAREEAMGAVVDDMVAADDDGEGVVTMLRGADLREALEGADGTSRQPADPLAGPFAHVVVDEAQELTDADWLMLLARCPAQSLTIAGDRAQARHGFAGSWRERLGGVGLHRVEIAPLSVNYRTPREAMAAAEPVIRAVLPDANVPTSVRSSGIPVTRGRVSELAAIVADWEASNRDGIGCVVGASDFAGTERVRSLPPEQVKGLEFDLVVLVDAGELGDGLTGAVDRYVAMTRTTQRLFILT